MDARELSPTFDPLEPVHNPVTEPPAKAYNQPLVTYLDPKDEGKSLDEKLHGFVDKVFGQTTSNELREHARSLQGAIADSKKVSITKYEEQPAEFADKTTPVPRLELDVTNQPQENPFEGQEIIKESETGQVARNPFEPPAGAESHE